MNLLNNMKNNNNMTNKEVLELVEEIDNKLWKYYNKIYSDDSNDLFDALHDDVYYQLQGWAETKDEFYDELETSESHVNGWADSWARSLRDDKEMVLQIEEYYNSVTKAPSISWVYA